MHDSSASVSNLSIPFSVLDLVPVLSGKTPSDSFKNSLDIPIWLLGSSTYSAQLAGILGLPFAFASHFAPAQLFSALQVYRESFRPSESLKEPYLMACVNEIMINSHIFDHNARVRSYEIISEYASGRIK